MLENFIVGLILAALTAITFLAYKHPTAYNKLSPTISKIAMAIVIAITAYNFGLIKARDAIREHISITNSSLIMNAIESREISTGIAFLIYFAYIVYFIFLDNLPYLFKDEKKTRTKTKRDQ